jgi:hypothetical protein
MSLSLFRGHASVRFDEPDIAAVVPACVPYVAAALAAGWQLARDGGANHMDVLHGCKHLVDFRKASRRQLQRAIYFRFVAEVRVVEGEKLRVGDFVFRCMREPAFFRAAQQLPRYRRKLEQLQVHLKTVDRHLLAGDPDAHDRQLIVPMAGGDVKLIKRLAEDYEEGW